MDSALEMMLEKYGPRNEEERENAIKEILQEIALAGLSRGGFFEKAAFYGGTCLRIFHGLDRFSEDLDFALTDRDPDFHLEKYLPALKKEFLSYGIDIAAEAKKKDTEVQSAFLKANTVTLMMSFFPKGTDVSRIMADQKMKVKLEIDTENPEGGITEYRYRMLPSPYEIRIFDETTLFAGKIHAVLCRDYKGHVKGRDYYDYLFYIGKGTRINMEYLQNKLRNSGKIEEEEVLTSERLKKMLEERFRSVDYKSAVDDVSRFITRKESLRFWKAELFLSTLDQLNI